MRHRTLVALAFLFVALGCARHPKVKVVDLSVARVPAMAKIAIDGRADEPAWEGAVAIPFEKTGKAMFLWDETKVYGFVQKYEHQRFGFAPDEQICISIRAGRKIVKLFLEQESLRGRPAALSLREAWAADWPSEAGSREALSTGSFDVVSLSGAACQGFGWVVEFSVDWDCLSDTGPPSERTSILVYRLIPHRPTTHVVRMEGVGAEEDVQ